MRAMYVGMSEGGLRVEGKTEKKWGIKSHR